MIKQVLNHYIWQKGGMHMYITSFDKHRENKLISKGKNGLKNYKLPYQLKQMNWEFHVYDSDFSPSVPHGHCGKYRLDVITGAIIDSVTGIIVKYLNKKDIERLLSDRKFQKLAVKAREYYLSQNPGKVLPEINFIKNRLKRDNPRFKVNSLDINMNKYSRMFGVKSKEIKKRELKYVFKTIIKLKE